MKKMISILTVSLLAFLSVSKVSSQSVISHNLPVGTPKGSFAVSPLGGATYSISIDVPQGLSGMTPQISIVYNSLSGNGLAGFGCSISGISVITRGPRSIWYDDKAGGITHGMEDAFFLDGERLIEQENIAGRDSVVYCLESNPYMRIVLHGRNGSSQTGMWFQVTAPDGTKSEFGHSSGQQTYSKNSVTRVNAWYITRMENTIGNYMTFQYTTNNYYLYPYRIYYGPNSIQFTYETRSDTQPFSLEGVNGSIAWRLKTIKSLTGTSVYREYTLNYNATSDATGSKFSRLTTATVKNGSGEALNPIAFDWEYLKQFNTQSQALNVSLKQSSLFVTFSDGFEMMTADLNGDGVSDVIQHAHVESIEENDGIRRYFNDYYVFLSSLNNQGNASYSSSSKRIRLSPNINHKWKSYVNAPIVGDFDGDQYQDIVLPYALIDESANSFYFFIPGKYWLDTDSTIIVTYTSHNPSETPLYTAADFDNDGRSDLLLLEQAGQNNYYHCHIFQGNADISNMNEYHTTLTLSEAPKKLISGDFNCDGLTDILALCSNRYYIFWNNGGGLSSSSFTTTNSKTATNLTDNKLVREGDFNGDGLPDLLTNTSNSGNWYFYLGKSDGTFTQQLACTINTYNQTGDEDKLTCLVYDMDGDGKSDVYMSKALSSQLVRSYWMLSNGTSLTQRMTSSSTKEENALPGYYMLGSFRGDGQCELAHYGYDCFSGSNSSVTSSLRMFPNNNYAPANGRMKAVTNGLGQTTHINYKSLTDKTVYTMSKTGDYPLFYIKPAMPVVATATVGNGEAGSQISHYTYEDLLIHNPGRGLIGFTTTTVENETLGITTETSVDWDAETLLPSRSWQTQTVGNSSAITENSYICQLYHNTKALYHSLIKSEETDLDNHQTTTVYSCDSTRHNIPLVITQSGYDNTEVRTTYNNYVYKAGQYLPTSVSIRKKHPNDTQYFTTTDTYSYNNKGQKTSETNLYGTYAALTTAYTYDNYGNVTNTTTTGSGVESITKQYTYDSTHRFVTQSLERGYIKNVYTYDTWGNVLTATDQTRSSYPQTTTYTYDGWGRPTTAVSPIGTTSTCQRGWTSGTLYYVETAESGQPWVKTYYDNVGRKMRTESIGPKGVAVKESLVYNSKGQLISRNSTTGFVGITETFTYDNRGRTLSDNFSSGETTSYSYGSNWIRTTKNGHNYTKYYDSWGNVKTSNDPVSSVSYLYYSNGSPKSASTGGKTVSMQYDAAGRRTKLTDPSAGVTTYTYDAYGRIATQTDARGYTTMNTYDSRGQLTSSTTGTITDNYIYGSNASNNGLLTGASRNGYSSQYTYDSYGRLSNETRLYGTVNKSMSFTYDAQGHIATQTYPNQLQVTYQYDNYGFIDRMLSGTKQLYEHDEYTGDTNVAILDDDITSVETYDDYGRIDEAAFNFSSGSDKYYQKYVYQQSTGNISGRNIGDLNGNMEVFAYDQADRLTSWTKNGTTQYYTYEQNGNMSLKQGLGSMYYNLTNPYAVSDLENPLGALALPRSEVVTEYNEFGKVKKIDSNGFHTTIAYGPDNQRWRSTLSDNVLFFDNYEEVTTGSVTRTFVYLENGVLAVSDNTNGTQFYYMATDHLGSIIGIVDGSGNEVFAASYDPWGKQTVTRNDLGFRRGFTGHEMLPHYDLINMNGRLYDPYLARFLSPDKYVQLPEFSQSFNRYSYCLNNPLKYTDPSGELFGIDDMVLFSLAVSTYVNICTSIANGDNLGKSALSGLVNFAANLGLAYATNGIGNILGHGTQSFGTEMLRAGLHGVLQGAGSVVNGEKFGTGFLTGSIASLVGSGASALGVPSHLTTASMGLAGGITSELSGGHWYNGVMTGINIGLLNHGWEKINGEWYYVSDGVEIIGHRPTSGTYHMALDAAGLFFDFADLINAGLYALEGDYLNAGISGTAAIPFFGTIATSGKNAMNAAEILSKFGPKYTKSTAAEGRKIHELYKFSEANNEMKFKEFRGVTGQRPDFVDLQNHKIYELKPYNPRGVKNGIKQLERYRNAYEKNIGGNWETFLDFY